MNGAKQEPTKLHAGRMEIAVVDLINYRVHTIVPNVSWGFGLNHECDLLVMDSNLRLTEIEIKISKSDLKADFKKNHSHESRHISRLVYAVPEPLVETAKDLIPNSAGLISVYWHQIFNGIGYYKARWVKKCRHDKSKSPITQQKAMELMNLGCMRIWTLKNKLHSK